MRRFVPAPAMSAFLAILWLVLVQSLAPGHLLLALLLGLWVPYATRRIRPLQPRLRRPGAMLRLFAVVLVDVVRSCIHVSAIILGKPQRRQRSGFIGIPLDLRDPYGLAVLSTIIKSTPGTVWAEVSADRRWLMIHVLDLHDEQWWIDTIKGRYEKPLMAIFE